MTSLFVTIKDDSKTDDVIKFLQDIDFLEVTIQEGSSDTKKKCHNNLSDAFGIWSDKDVTLKEIRSKAWR